MCVGDGVPLAPEPPSLETASTHVKRDTAVRVQRVERLSSQSHFIWSHLSLPQIQWGSPECMFIKAMLQGHLLLA